MTQPKKPQVKQSKLLPKVATPLGSQPLDVDESEPLETGSYMSPSRQLAYLDREIKVPTVEPSGE